MDAHKLIDAIEFLNYTPRSYTGRGMYGGKECVAITIPSNGSSLKYIARLAVKLLDDGEDLGIVDIQEDSMGKGSVVYFPRVEWPSDVEEYKESGEDEDE